MPLRSRRLLALQVAFATFPFALYACGGTDTSGTLSGGNVVTPTGSSSTGSGTSSGSAAGSGSSSTGSGSSSTGSSSTGSSSSGLTELADEDICEQVDLAVEFLPLDMLIMLDQSVSMTDPVEDESETTRWEAITQALGEFFEHPDAQDIRVAYDFYANPDDTVELGVYSCDPENYNTPEVDLDLVPTAGPAIEQLLGDTPAGTLTPTYPALEGALMWATANKEANPAKATVVLLATDGLPFSNGSCNDSVAAIANLAQDAYRGDNSVRTFVIGVGAGQYNLETIADQGGGQAFVIEGGDVASEFLEAMLTIVNQPPTCDVTIPEPMYDDQVVDGTRARVTLFDGLTGESEQIRQMSSAQDCLLSGTLDGFYFDNPRNPTKITVCPTTCRKLGRSSIRLDLACRVENAIQ